MIISSNILEIYIQYGVCKELITINSFTNNISENYKKNIYILFSKEPQLWHSLEVKITTKSSV